MNFNCPHCGEALGDPHRCTSVFGKQVHRRCVDAFIADNKVEDPEFVAVEGVRYEGTKSKLQLTASQKALLNLVLDEITHQQAASPINPFTRNSRASEAYAQGCKDSADIIRSYVHDLDRP